MRTLGWDGLEAVVRRGLVLGLLAAALALASVGPAAAVTYYVDQATGSDANTGLSEQAAWATVTRAMGLSPGTGPTNGAGPGDVVLIKNGTYFRNYTPGNSYDPCYNPRNSGTAGNPITFRAFPGHAVVLDCNEYGPADSQGSPVFGATFRSFITYDGISVVADSKKNVMINGARNITVRNGVIDRIPRVGNVGVGNYYCFFVQNSQFVTITRFLCRDSFTGSSPSDANAGGIVNFNSQFIHAHHNDFINVGLCLDDKEAGRNNIWEYNYCAPAPGGRAMQFTALGNFCSDCSVRDTMVRFNVFRGPGDLAINVSANTDNVNIYNNTIFQFNTALRTRSGATASRFYNNIGVLTGNAHRYVSTGPAPSLISNFNLYQATTLRFAMTDLGGFETLASWQGTASTFHPGVAQDAASRTGDPQFVNATPDVAVDFRLQAGSPAVGAGNTAADGIGSVIDLGAFAVPGNTPGRDGDEPPADPLAPGLPLNVRVRPPA